jgi:spore coat polysaccharide biosynthesis predicted glycosyltransferase SpsG
MLSSAECVVIDSYIASVNFYAEASKIAKIAVYVDDNMRLDYPPGVLINCNIYAEELNYPKKKGYMYLLGRRYALLRKEFRGIPRKIINESVKEIMVTLGGYDAKGLTPRVLRLLTSHYPDLKKKVVLGKAFSNTEEIEKSRDGRTELVCGPDASTISRLMSSADIAISSGGQTICELAFLGVPTIGFSVVDNQAANVDAWNRLGFLELVSWDKESEFSGNLLGSLQRLHSFSARKSKSELGKQLIDGMGTLNAVNKILEYVGSQN